MDDRNSMHVYALSHFTSPAYSLFIHFFLLLLLRSCCRLSFVRSLALSIVSQFLFFFFLFWSINMCQYNVSLFSTLFVDLTVVFFLAISSWWSSYSNLPVHVSIYVYLCVCVSIFHFSRFAYICWNKSYSNRGFPAKPTNLHRNFQAVNIRHSFINGV